MNFFADAASAERAIRELERKYAELERKIRNRKPPKK